MTMQAATTTKKQNIIRIAAELFRERGYKATSMRDLASAVGIEASSIYSHISSKEDILTSICMESAARFVSGMDEVENRHHAPAEKIKALIRLHTDIASNFPGSVIVFNGDWKHLPDSSLTPFVRQRREYEARFRRILDQGKKEGVFTFYDSGIVFDIIMQSLTWPYEASSKYDKEAVKTELTDFIMRSLEQKTC